MMIKKKTGFIFLTLAGISIPWLLHSIQGPRQTARAHNVPAHHQAVLQQIPPRVKPLTTSEPADRPESAQNHPDAAVITSEMLSRFTSEEILSRLVGRWEQTKSTSKQILTIKENGTATMVVEPQGLWKSVLGDRITINIEWSLNNTRLTLRTVGGSPQNKLEYINQLWGDEFVREIHTIEDKMFTLRDDSGDVSQKWIRTTH